MARVTNRRLLLQMLGGVTLLAVGGGDRALAQSAKRIVPLIAKARALDLVSARIAFISTSLLGARYRANTLIGGPSKPEEFVVRDDAFDCVTFCEVVLAAALARDNDDFERILRTIRYASGVVRWDERNHYFAEWCRRAIEHDICRPVELPKALTIDKTVNWGNHGKRQVAIRCIPTESLLASPRELVSGDIIGFVSRRANLDFFHTGLVMIGPKSELTLRHASESRRRVLDEPLRRFLATNKVQYVTLLRALERPPITRGA
jgi:N-acetylmuramoyl-L-alanine amidase-like